MSEQESKVLDRLAEIVPKLDERGQEKLGYICEGMALALESGKKDEHADDHDADAAGSL